MCTRSEVGIAVLLMQVAMVVATACAACAADADWSQARPVTVVASEYQFAPKKLTFKRGVVSRLHIETRGKDQHEFTAPEFFKAVTLRSTEALNADRIEVEVPPGAAKDLFFVARESGRYPLRCSDHDWAGMTGAITVK
jgi:uncharacterized cupredoxin-like copper-binding protein